MDDTPATARAEHPSGDKRFRMLDAAMKRQQHRPDALIEVLHAAQPPELVDQQVRAALSGIDGIRLAPLEPGHVRLVIRRAPLWTVLVAILAFPVGLVALFFREDVPLDVWVYGTGHGTQVQLNGRTEAHLLERARAALLAVPGLRTDQAVGV